MQLRQELMSAAKTRELFLSIIRQGVQCVNTVVITISHLLGACCYCFTTDCLPHTAEMVVVEPIWQFCYELLIS